MRWVSGPASGATAQTNSPALSFLTMATKPAFRTDYTTAEAGRTAYYALRWLSTRGETGPWSEIAAATVAA